MQLLWVTLMTVIPVQFAEAGYIECLLVVYAGWMHVLYHLMNYNKVFINRRTIKNVTICSK